MKIDHTNTARLFFSTPGIVAFVILAVAPCIAEASREQHAKAVSARTHESAGMFQAGTNRILAESLGRRSWRFVRQKEGFGIFSHHCGSCMGCRLESLDRNNCYTVTYRGVEVELRTSTHIHILYERTGMGDFARDLRIGGRTP